MNYKFIEKTQHTQKKYNFNTQARNFTRKKSLPSERSSSARKTKSAYPEHYILNPHKMIQSTLMLEKDDFFVKLASIMAQQEMKNPEQKKLTAKKPQKKYQINKNEQQSNYKIQLDLLNHQLIMLQQKHQKVKLYHNQQYNKRKELQIKNNQLNQQLQQTNTALSNQKMLNKKYHKQKQYLLKQIQFLQKINYDDQNKNLQSYREKYLQEQLMKIRQQCNKKSQVRQKQLQEQLIEISRSKQILQSKYKALQVGNRSLNKKIVHLEQKYLQSVLNSEEYINLRNKYKLFLEEYKRLRIQFKNLKEKGKQNSISLNITPQEEDDLTNE